MKVQEIMSTTVLTCHPDDSHEQAARLMWEHDCGVVPVVDEEQRVVGMLTDRDVCMGAYTSGCRLADLRVARSMATRVHSCRPEDSIERALEEMREARVRRLPVVDSRQHVVGLLSIGDVLRNLARLDERGRSGLGQVTLGALGGICETDGGASTAIAPRAREAAKPAPAARGSARGVTAG